MTLAPIFCDWSDETATSETDFLGANPSVASMRWCLARLVQPWKSNRKRAQVVCSLYDTPLVVAPATMVTRVFENVLLNALAAVEPVGGTVRVTVRSQGERGVLEVHAAPVIPQAEELGVDIVRTLLAAFDGELEVGDEIGSRRYRVSLPLAGDGD